jgi:5-methyltetrahydropteroyltriglutamate--homocysteine methyltransferase
MEPVDRHRFEPDISFDGGDLDCGNLLLLLIRQQQGAKLTRLQR